MTVNIENEIYGIFLETQVKSKRPVATFWDKIEARMNERGLIAESLADVSGVDKQKISRWKKGQPPKLGDALRAAIALDVSLDYLADDEVPIKNPPASRERIQRIIGLARRLDDKLDNSAVDVLEDALSRDPKSLADYLGGSNRHGS